MVVLYHQFPVLCQLRIKKNFKTSEENNKNSEKLQITELICDTFGIGKLEGFIR
jgi:hypothetical protein